MTRGVLYITWPGEGRMPAMLARSRESLARVHPEFPVHVAELPDGSTLLDKARMYDLSPFDQTLFLDADTVVMGNLDYGFEKAKAHGIALCICECPWARRFEGLKDRGDLVEFNTGVVWFDKNFYTNRHEYDTVFHDGVDRLFDRWRGLAGGTDSSMEFMSGDGKAQMPINDQASFALAVEEEEFNPFVLPMNWNFRHRWQKTVFGPVKIWHDYDDVPDSIVRWNEQQSRPDAVIQCGRVA